MTKLFKELKAGLEDAIAHRQGKLKLRSEIIEVPEPPIKYKPIQIKKIREKNQYSKGMFARILNVNVNTVQAWEDGQRHPRSATLRLLEIIDNGIYHPQISKKSN